jgi:hypothetical protein
MSHSHSDMSAPSTHHQQVSRQQRQQQMASLFYLTPQQFQVLHFFDFWCPVFWSHGLFLSVCLIFFNRFVVLNLRRTLLPCHPRSSSRWCNGI